MQALSAGQSFQAILLGQLKHTISNSRDNKIWYPKSVKKKKRADPLKAKD